MIYKTFQGLQLPALGFGCMRLPGGYGNADVDVEETRRMIRCAFDHGVNYFDTAWGYHDGRSETVLGELLSEYPRESYFLADKFPGYDLSNMDKVQEIFEEQLRRCRVDYFDFYLFHNVCELNIDGYLNPAYGIFDYLLEQKKNGRIRHFGFSSHGHMDTLKRFLAAYGKDMEFCQLQINYLDWQFQDAKGKVALLKEHGIPVWVMEPLRGGTLTHLSPENEAALRAMRPDESITAWAFRFLQTLPDVTLTLSGMSSLEQMEQNIRTFDEPKPLSDTEMDTLLSMAGGMMKKGTVPCTACRYCTSHCPMELDIPYLISLYNEHAYSGGGFIAPMALSALPAEKQPSACVGCGSCAAVCPQQIQIPDVMADFTKRLKAE
ncbi:MAG: oxidoreductase [Ruminococcaceae bacterium]|nr:oxidoreductase [Oscillospiraceae bacterium]